MDNVPETEKEKVIINPYNFNNKLINKHNVHNILSKYNVDYDINDIAIYQKSFVHKSYSKKKDEEMQPDVELAEKPEGALELQDSSNETLEFLGDSVLNSVTAKYLFQRYPNEEEGFLTKLRTKLVCGETLGKLAKDLNLGEYLLISRHVEERCNGRESTRILEDVFESFIGALFLDFCNNYKSEEALLEYSGPGFQICELFIINVIESHIDFSELILKDYNYKDQLLRYFQQKYQQTPKYKEVLVEGPPHDRIFTMAVIDTSGMIISEGTERSKKKAEQLASLNALIKLGVIQKSEN